MAYNKVIYGGQVLIDLTADTITADKLLANYTAHDKSGSIIEGSCTYDADTSDATAGKAEILKTKTAYVNGVKIVGDMTNNGAVSGTISTKDGKYTVPQGYHDGSGTVQISSTEKSKLISSNIRQGVTILGIEGSMSSTEGLLTQSKTVTPSSTQQVVNPDSGYNALASVTVNAIPYVETNNDQGGVTVTIG